MSSIPIAIAPRRLRRLAVLLWALAIAGCAHPVFKLQPIEKPQPPPIWSGTNSDLADDAYFTPESLSKRFWYESVREAASPDKYEYSVGLALSGGGAKAASYAMGVLEALYANRILQYDINVISTVSGGGYSAYWYYSRLADTYLGNQRFLAEGEAAESRQSRALRDLPDFFSECMPTPYTGLLPVSGEPPAANAQLEWPRPACPSDDRWLVDRDTYRFQNHLRGFADVLSNDFELGLERNELVLDVGKAVGLTLATLPGHIVSNLLFDWRVELSPSQRQYQRGIERTYGLAPIDLSGGCGDDILSDPPGRCDHERPSPNRLVGRGLTFATLQLARKQQQAEWENRAPSTAGSALAPRIPLLVVNTTAGVSKTPFDLLEQAMPDFEDSVFEFTPAAFGSRLYGRWPGSHPDVDVVTAASASAAFFDSQQRTMARPARAAVGSLLRLLQLEWGKDIANPWKPDRLRGRHAALPFPFYLLHKQTKSPKAPFIHLSDGGQSDNTGVFALIRRGVRTIILADAAQDTDGIYKDLCTLRRQLKRKRLYLHIPSLNTTESTFAMECDAAKSDRKAHVRPHDLWKMESPLLHACVTREALDTQCVNDDGVRYFGNIYVLKPSLNLPALRAHVQECQASKDGASSDGYLSSLDTEACRSAYANAAASLPRLPREVFGFLVRNWKKTDAEGHPVFPQHSTWKITLNSSSTLFGAYKALGRWQTERLLLENAELCTPNEATKRIDSGVGARVPLEARVCKSRH